jgi:hypothetical protein
MWNRSLVLKKAALKVNRSKPTGQNMKTTPIQRSIHGLLVLTTFVAVPFPQYSLAADPPFTLNRKLVAPDGAQDDRFGWAVAVGGDTAVVGAQLDDIGGNFNQGSVYVFERNAGGSNNWGFIKRLTASDGAASDVFGYAVAIDGDVLVVGAVNDVGSDFNFSQGSAYVFYRNAGGANTWGEVRKLTASDGAGGDYFGYSVSVSGDVIAVGARDHDVGDNFDQGSAYVFERNTGGDNNWGQTRKLIADDGAASDAFGISVSVSGDVVVVGAYVDDVGTNFDQGSAYVFERDAGGANNWGQVKQLVASDGASDDRFGSSIGVNGSTVVAGAPFGQGSAYVFERDAGGANNWGQVRKLTAAGEIFGNSVSVSGDVIAVGAAWDDVGPNFAQGSAYAFERNTGGANNWGQTQKLTALDGASDDWFGYAVAVSGGVIVAGAFPADVSGRLNQGSAYAFNRHAGAYPLQILRHPQSRTNFSESTTAFNVIAIGEQLGYEWRKNGVPLANGGRVTGATSTNLVLAGVQSSDSGAYIVVVSNSFGTATSEVAILKVIDLAGAVDASSLVWSSDGHALWLDQSSVTHDGEDAAQSGGIGDNRESWLQTTVNGPGTLAFWWKVSSEMDYDVFEFSIDDLVRRRISGEEDWEQPSVVIAAGNHTLRWRYFKDSSRAIGQDAAWLDQVVFMPDSGPAVIVAQPIGRTAGSGDTVTLVAGVGGATPRIHQWFKNDIAIAGAFNVSLTLSNVGLADGGHYHLLVSNAFGSTSSSDIVLDVTTNGPVATVLLFADEPSTSPYRSGLTNMGVYHQLFIDPVAFSTAVANASPASTLVIVGVLRQSFSLNAVGRFANAGGRTLMQYPFLHAGSILTPAFNASVAQQISSAPPPIYNWGSPFFAGLSSPISMTKRYNLSGQFLRPTATGQGVAGYPATPTANQSTILIGHSGRTILNGFNMEEVALGSDATRLARNEIEYFYPSLAIVVPPTNQGVRLGSNATFTVTAFKPTGPIAYQWRFNGTNLPGAITATLVITNVQLAHEGVYAVVVSDTQGSIASSDATLSVLINPAFVQRPLNQSVVIGGNVTFSVEVSGHPPPFEYEWRRVTAPQFTNNFVLNERRSFFTINNVQSSVNYTVRVRNAANPRGLSSGFTLTVLADADSDGLPDVWETTYPTAVDPTSDADGDGVSNRDEYTAGTNPTNALSYLKIDRIEATGSATLWFNAASNKTYAVEYTDDLAGGAWSKLADVVARSTNRTETITDPASATNRFYRLVTPRQP